MVFPGAIPATASSYNGGGSSRSGERSDSSSCEVRYLLVDPLYALSLSLDDVAGVCVVAGVYEAYPTSKRPPAPEELDSLAASAAFELPLGYV